MSIEQESFNNQFQKKIQITDNESIPSFEMIILSILFKLTAIISYFVFANYPLIDFIVVLISTSIDFWTTKNLTGRKLMGLRWWIEIDQETGQQTWIFQSRNSKNQTNKINQAVFWGGITCYLAFWAVILIINMIIGTLFWISLSCFNFLLTAVNFQCFCKCLGKQKKNIMKFMNKIGINTEDRMVNGQLQSNENQ